MANAFRIDPTKLPINWQTGTNYRFSLEADFIKESAYPFTPNLGVTTATTFTTFGTPITITSSTPFYNSTTNITGTFAIIYDRKFRNYGVNKFWYLYKEGYGLVTQISTTSNLVSRVNKTFNFSLQNLLQSSSTYYLTADQGVVKDLFGFESPAITDNSVIRFSTAYATDFTATNFLNYNLTATNGVTKFIDISYADSISTGSGNIVIYKADGTPYHTWGVNDTFGITVNDKNVRVQTNYYKADVAPEGTYYLGYNVNVFSNTSGSTVALIDPNRIRWTQSILQGIGNPYFNSGTNFIFTGTNPNIIFTEGVIGTATNRLLTLKLSSQDGQFGHATTGTTSGTFWIVTGTEAYLNGLWNTITYTPNLLFTSTYQYELSYSAGILATGSNVLNYSQAAFIFPSQLQLDVQSDSYLGTGSPYVVNEPVTFFANINTSTQINQNLIFRIDGITFASVPMQFSNGVNFAQTTTSFTSTGSRQIEVVWPAGLVGDTLYLGQSVATTTNIVAGYSLSAPIEISASLPRVIQEDIVFTASVFTTTLMLNTLTIFANGISLGSTQFNSATNQAILTATIASSGTYTISAIWDGGILDNNRFYLTKNANTASIFVENAADFLYPFTLTANTYTNSVGSSTILTAVLSTTTNLSGPGAGNVTFRETTYNKLLGVSTITSNTSVLIVPGDTFSTASVYSYIAQWSGSTLPPKFKGRTSTATSTLLARSTAYPRLSVNDFYRNNIDGLTFRTVQTATVVVTGTYATHQPGGSVQLYDGATFIATAPVNNGQADFSWTPTDFNQLDSGTRTLSAIYLQDSWNNSATTTATFVARTRRPTNITLNISTTSLVRPASYAITVNATSTYFNSRTVDIIDGVSFIATATFTGTTATYLIDSRNIPLGNVNINARFNQDYAYQTAISNTVTVNVSKGNIPITLDLNTASMTIPYTGGNYQIRRPEIVRFRSKTTASVIVPRTVTLRSGTGVKFNWFTATHVGTLTEITTSSSYFDLETFTGGQLNQEYYYEYQRQETYDLLAPETTDYTTATSNSIVIYTGRKMLSPLTLSIPSTLTKPDNLLVTLSSTGTDWIGRTINIYASYQSQPGSYKHTTFTNILSTITLTSNVMTATIAHGLLEVGSPIIYANLKPTYQAQAWSTNSNYIIGDKVFYEGSNWYYGENYTYNSFVGPQPPSSINLNVRKVTDIDNDYQSLGTTQSSITIYKRSPQILIEGPRASNFTLNSVDGNTNIVNNSFDRQFMSGQNLRFTATTTASYMEGKVVNLMAPIQTYYIPPATYMFTATDMIATGTIVNGKVEFVWPTNDTRVQRRQNRFEIVYSGDDSINSTTSINTWTQFNNSVFLTGWYTYLNEESAYNDIEIRPSTLTVYTNTTVVITGTVYNSTYRTYLEGKPIYWTTGTNYSNPIASSIMTNGQVELVITGTNVPNNLQIYYNDNVWFNLLTSPTISFTKIP